MFMFDSTNLDQAFLCGLLIKRKIHKKPRFSPFHNPNPNTRSISNIFNSTNPHPFSSWNSPNPIPHLNLSHLPWCANITRPKHMMLLKVNSYNNKSNPKHYFMMRKLSILSQHLPPLNFILLLKLILFQTLLPLTNPFYRWDMLRHTQLQNYPTIFWDSNNPLYRTHV